MRRLRTLRLQRFLTQKELGEAVGVPYQTLQRWEAGLSFPWPSHVRKLCEVLDVGPTDLVDADEWPQPRTRKTPAPLEVEVDAPAPKPPAPARRTTPSPPAVDDLDDQEAINLAVFGRRAGTR